MSCRWSDIVYNDLSDLKRYRGTPGSVQYGVIEIMSMNMDITQADTHWSSSQISFVLIYTSLGMNHIDGFEQYCSNSIANALELLQFCTKPPIYLCQGTVLSKRYLLGLVILVDVELWVYGTCRHIMSKVICRFS